MTALVEQKAQRRLRHQIIQLLAELIIELLWWTYSIVLL